MPVNKLHGVIAAVPTPFTDRGKPDLERFLLQCRWALSNGCNGLNVLGTTGEATSMDRGQRVDVMRTASKALEPRHLMVGTGGTPALAETIELTRYAAELGYAGALILPPYYYKPVSEDGLFAYFSRIIDSLPSSDFGIYLYNIPQMTGIAFSQDLIHRLVNVHKGRIYGLKDSSGDLDYARSIQARFPHLDIFPSDESVLSEARESGFAGCISASVNLTATLAERVWKHGKRSPAEDNANLSGLRKKIVSFPLIPCVKALIGIRENDPEWTTVLPPLTKLSSEQMRQVSQVADTLGFEVTEAVSVKPVN